MGWVSCLSKQLEIFMIALLDVSGLRNSLNVPTKVLLIGLGSYTCMIDIQNSTHLATLAFNEFFVLVNETRCDEASNNVIFNIEVNMFLNCRLISCASSVRKGEMLN